MSNRIAVLVSIVALPLSLLGCRPGSDNVPPPATTNDASSRSSATSATSADPPATAATETGAAQPPDPILRLTQVKSYRAKVIEHGVLPQNAELKTEVVYRWPNDFRTVTLSPPRYQGTSAQYADHQLVYSFPQLHYAIRINHVDLPDGAASEKLLLERSERYQREYAYRLGASEPVAGYPTFTLFHRALQTDNPQREGFHRVYHEYAFPLAGEMVFRDGVKYSYEYESIEFNAAVKDAELAQPIPGYFWVTDWDLASQDYPLAEAEKGAKFELAFPTGKPRGFERGRIIRASGPAPAFMASYRRGSELALIAAFRYAQSPPEYGIPVKTSKTGRLLVTPLLSSYTFLQHGVTYIVLGNAAFEDILYLGDRVGT